MTGGRPAALTVAGSDSGGGAGIVADCKTFEAMGVWGAVAVTAVTAQNTEGIVAVEVLRPELVAAQVAAVAGDLTVSATKTGMLGSAAVVRAVADVFGRARVGPVVVDPVVRSSSGSLLLDDDGLDAMRRDLLPLAALITPNRAEAAALTGGEVGTRSEVEGAAGALLEAGCAAALVTGHITGEVASDCLVRPGMAPEWLEGPFLAGVGDPHGTGCVLSAAICAGLARGWPLDEACRRGKRFTAAAIRAATRVGGGAWVLRPGAGGEGGSSWRA